MTDEEYEDSFYGIHPKQIVPGTLFIAHDPSTYVNLLVLGNVSWKCFGGPRPDWTRSSEKICWEVTFEGLHGETGKKCKFKVEGVQNRYYNEITWEDYFILLPVTETDGNNI